VLLRRMQRDTRRTMEAMTMLGGTRLMVRRRGKAVRNKIFVEATVMRRDGSNEWINMKHNTLARSVFMFLCVWWWICWSCHFSVTYTAIILPCASHVTSLARTPTNIGNLTMPEKQRLFWSTQLLISQFIISLLRSATSIPQFPSQQHLHLR
jgi:hypothetical protein